MTDTPTAIFSQDDTLMLTNEGYQKLLHCIRGQFRTQLVNSNCSLLASAAPKLMRLLKI